MSSARTRKRGTGRAELERVFGVGVSYAFGRR